jgi:hypothetical protein
VYFSYQATHSSVIKALDVVHAKLRALSKHKLADCSIKISSRGGEVGVCSLLDILLLLCALLRKVRKVLYISIQRRWHFTLLSSPTNSGNIEFFHIRSLSLPTRPLACTNK